ncbi:MAG: hypothetical protein E6Q78_05285 [Rhodoferax sp.]|nr:MAG: hypothetical protein E6Q78_05285 [Rhodoferax sp.]
MAEVIGIRITAHDETQTALAGVQRELAQVNTAASTVGATLAGLGIGVSVAGFVAFTQNIINGVDALNDLKDATGSTIENISALEDIARRSGTGLDTVSTALVKMNQALSSAKPGSDAERAINALGLSVQQLKAQDPVVAFKGIADALGGYADDANKARLVQEIFGKSLKEVAPLLKDTAEATGLVATATTEQAEAAEKLNKQFFALQANASNAGRTMVAEFLPTINSIADELLKADTAGGNLAKTFGSGIKTVFEAVAIAGANVAFVLKGVGREVGGIVAQFSAMGEAGGIFTQAGRNAWTAVGEAMREDGERARKELDDLERRIMGAATGATSGSTAPTKGTVGDLGGGPDKATIAAANRELSEQKKLIAELSGLSGSFAEEWNRLNTMFGKGKLSLDQLTQAQATLLEKQPAMRTAAKELEDAQKEAAKQAVENANDYIKAVEEQQKAASSIRDQVDAERQHVASIGLTKEAVTALLVQRMEEQALTKDRLADYLTENNLSAELAQSYREQAAGLRDLAKLKVQGSAKEAAAEIEKENQKAADKAASDWQRAAERIQDSITDALMRGFESGKGFAENLRDVVVNMFKTMVLRPVVEMGVRGGLSILGLGGASGAASASDAIGSVGSASNAFNGLSQLGGMSSWFTNFGESAANGIIKAGEMAYQAGFESIGSSMMSLQEAGNFSAVADGLNMVGDGLGYLNAAMAASEGKWGKAIGSAVGTYFGGPLGAAIGGAVGGWIDDAFGGGREYTTGTGISGRFSGSTFTGRNYQDWRNDGSSGFFGIGASGSSSGTNYSAMDAGQAKSLGAAYGAIISQTAGFATALGASADSIKSFQKDIKLALGADAEANKKAIADMFRGVADEIAATVLDAQYIREGEGAADTLARLASNLTLVNGSFDSLGKTMLAISQGSGDAASALVDVFGGVQQFQTVTAAYYQRFYSEEERLANTREQLSSQLGALGVSMPDTVEAYRELVSAQDVTTESGRKTYATLLSLSGAFADVSESAAEAAKQLIMAARYGTYAEYAAASAAAGAVATPRFASGGFHGGGIRLVGENGPELETTGASRIWNQSQMAGAVLSGSSELASKIDALRDDSRAQARAMAALQSRMVKLFETWDAKGMPEVRTL